MTASESPAALLTASGVVAASVDRQAGVSALPDHDVPPVPTLAGMRQHTIGASTDTRRLDGAAAQGRLRRLPGHGESV